MFQLFNIARLFIYLYRRFKLVIWALLILLVVSSFIGCNKIVKENENEYRDVILDKLSDTDWEHTDYYADHPTKIVTDFVACTVAAYKVEEKRKEGDEYEVGDYGKPCEKFETADEATLQKISDAMLVISGDIQDKLMYGFSDWVSARFYGN